MFTIYTELYLLSKIFIQDTTTSLEILTAWCTLCISYFSVKQNTPTSLEILVPS